MANFAITDIELLDTVNYLASGPYSIGQEVEGVGESDTVYFTNNVSPYAVSGGGPAPSPAPAQNEWIRTDCFGSVKIFNPNQKISVGGQLRCFFTYRVDELGPDPDSSGGPNQARIRIYVSILRYTGTPDNLLTAGTEIVGTRTVFTDFSINPAPGPPPADNEFIGNQIMLSYIDEPGLTDELTVDPNYPGVYTPTVNDYTYWLQFRLEPITGVYTIESFYADVRSVYINVIKA